jgi:hypothetical protein
MMMRLPARSEARCSRRRAACGSRKTKAPDDWDPPYESYDPYGPGGVASDEFIDD